jgi:EF-P beta-lysylation protein EpmB
MIARTNLSWQSETWQRELAEGFRLPRDLLAWLDIDPRGLEADLDASNPFPLRVPLSYARRMRRGDAADPLLRQVLPLAAERAPGPADYSTDPVGDRTAMRSPGLLRKYHGRALMITTGACAVHCRYCFRRHFPYARANAREGSWQAALREISGDATIREVILSGGDPLMLATPQLAALIRLIEAVPHVARLRIHTRLPVVLPARIDGRLVDTLAGGRLRTVVVMHANHPNELDAEVAGGLGALAAAGVALFNQSVLLRGVNDDAAVLADLSEKLFEAGVTPYYLHLLDRVAGAAHFDVDAATARGLHAALAARLPGYLVPRLVREEAGADAKLAV